MTRLRYHRKLVAVYHRKLVAVSNLPATRFGDTITLPSQACGCEHLTSDEVWSHENVYYVAIASLWMRATISDEVREHGYVTIASLWLRATYQRRGLGTRLRYHRKLVALSNLPATRLGTRLRDHRKLVAVSNLPATRLAAVSNLPATRFGDTITLPSQACGCEQLTSDEVWGNDYVTIASLWL